MSNTDSELEADSQEKIIQQLIKGDRHPVTDADDVENSGLDWINLVHSTVDNSESIILNFEYSHAFRTGDGHNEFDILDHE